MLLVNYIFQHFLGNFSWLKKPKLCFLRNIHEKRLIIMHLYTNISCKGFEVLKNETLTDVMSVKVLNITSDHTIFNSGF